jgi:hypothetical protein
MMQANMEITPTFNDLCMNNNCSSISQNSPVVLNNELDSETLQHVNYLKNLSQNYRTQPCKNYHSIQGCGRSIFCHFIHIIEFEGTYGYFYSQISLKSFKSK